MLPELVAKHWSEVAPMIEAAMPLVENVEHRRKQLLSSCLAGLLTCWGMLNDDNKLLGMATTIFTYDIVTGEKNLLIYSLLSTGTEPRLWQGYFLTLSSYAKQEGCKYIVGYTRVPRMKEIAKGLGADLEEIVIRLEVK
ncbi:MAG: hypothetical protein CO041_04265 [Candidatus Pacebacteria bacterium CG_4_9_14_0_2_um_filter_40_15]|nr:MAG: hypothetical protein COY01_03055 [Candidatus Pacebacteria bacterium CG_4_10_14_0_2_um_filter_40_20]PJC41489.1 MAG: hypothetical protein CO041_04265 [Candidatus Pacebacteria bacterium CG_4_9_14_0_2_um_filter_40_15]